MTDQPRTESPLVVVRGEATPQEVAALMVVVQGIGAARGAAATTRERPRSEWSANHRKVRSPLLAGPGGWRSSAMPR